MQEDWDENVQLYIPTKYVFIFIEKRPIVNYGVEVYQDSEELRNRPLVSYEAASQRIEYLEENESEYYIFQRNVIMSKAYFWACSYETYFNKEMTVYYEDNELIVYRIKQNEYALNNFAIDYGVNTYD